MRPKAKPRCFTPALLALTLLAPAAALAQSDLSGLQCTSSAGSASCTTLAGQANPFPSVYASQYDSLTITNDVTIGSIAIVGTGAYAGSSSPPLTAPSVSFTNNGTLNNAAGSTWSLDAGSNGWVGD